MARNGPQFEERIRENEKTNNKFCFLNPTDPYRAYYDHQVKQLREGGTGESFHRTFWTLTRTLEGTDKGISYEDAGKKAEAKADEGAAVAQEVVVKEPPKEPSPLEFLLETPTMLAQDM